MCGPVAMWMDIAVSSLQWQIQYFECCGCIGLALLYGITFVLIICVRYTWFYIQHSVLSQEVKVRLLFWFYESCYLVILQFVVLTLWQISINWYFGLVRQIRKCSHSSTMYGCIVILYVYATGSHDIICIICLLDHTILLHWRKLGLLRPTPNFQCAREIGLAGLD